MQKAFVENKSISSAVKKGFLTKYFQGNSASNYKMVYLQNGNTVLIKVEQDDDFVAEKIGGIVKEKIQNEKVKTLVLDLCSINCINSVKIAGLVAAHSLTASQAFKVNVITNDYQSKRLIEVLNPGNLNVEVLDQSLKTVVSA
ncbi:MAG: hypothetical protein WCK67_01225 [bacterium]